MSWSERDPLCKTRETPVLFLQVDGYASSGSLLCILYQVLCATLVELDITIS